MSTTVPAVMSPFFMANHYHSVLVSTSFSKCSVLSNIFLNMKYRIKYKSISSPIFSTVQDKRNKNHVLQFPSNAHEY